MPIITYREAINQAIAEEMEFDNNVFLLGEEVGRYNGAYKVTQNLLEKFGDDRIIDTPISESGFTGLAIGAAMMGLRPIVEFMTWSFSYVAFDQIINNAANIRYMSGGKINIPIVFRGPANGGVNVGATHSHTPENFYANIPGLKVVCPSTAYDAKGLLKTAIRDHDPVCIMENTILYNNQDEVPSKEYFIPLGSASIMRQGVDISFIGHGRGIITALDAARHLQDKYKINAEVLDIRSIRPLDVDSILSTAKKTNRIVLIDENKPFCGISSQISYIIQEEAFDYLHAPIKRVCAIDAPQIYSMPIEEKQLPDVERIVKTALSIC